MRSALESLFELEFYQERKVKPRRADNPTRLTLVLLSRWFNWRDALIVVRPRTLITWHRKGFRGGGDDRQGARCTK